MVPSSLIRGVKAKPNNFFSPLSLAVERQKVKEENRDVLRRRDKDIEQREAVEDVLSVSL